MERIFLKIGRESVILKCWYKEKGLNFMLIVICLVDYFE